MYTYLNYNTENKQENIYYEQLYLFFKWFLKNALIKVILRE